MERDSVVFATRFDSTLGVFVRRKERAFVTHKAAAAEASALDCSFLDGKLERKFDTLARGGRDAHTCAVMCVCPSSCSRTVVLQFEQFDSLSYQSSNRSSYRVGLMACRVSLDRRTMFIACDAVSAAL